MRANRLLPLILLLSARALSEGAPLTEEQRASLLREVPASRRTAPVPRFGTGASAARRMA